MSMTISKKLFTGCSALVGISLLIGGVGIHNIDNLGDSLDVVGHHYVHTLSLTGDMNNLTTDMLATSRGILLRGYMKDLASAAEYNKHFAEDMDMLQKESTEFAHATTHANLHDIAQNEILDKLDTLHKRVVLIADFVLP